MRSFRSVKGVTSSGRTGRTNQALEEKDVPPADIVSAGHASVEKFSSRVDLHRFYAPARNVPGEYISRRHSLSAPFTYESPEARSPPKAPANPVDEMKREMRKSSSVRR